MILVIKAFWVYLDMGSRPSSPHQKTPVLKRIILTQVLKNKIMMSNPFLSCFLMKKVLFFISVW